MERQFESIVNEFNEKGWVRCSLKEAKSLTEYLMLHLESFKCKVVNENSFIVSRNY